MPMTKPEEIRAANLMSTAAHSLANAIRTGAYPNLEAFLAGFATSLAGRLELIDGKQEPTVHASLSTMRDGCR
jgi:hypothetical protein